MTSLTKAKASAVPALPRHRFALKNGMKLVISPRAGAPVFAAQLHLIGGHSLDPAGKEGVGYLAGALLDQGTKRRSEEQISAILEPCGGTLQGDSTGIAGAIAADDWRALVDVMADCATQPAYPADRVRLQKARLSDRLRVDREDPRSRTVWLFREMIYGDQWLGRPEHGNEESVAKIRRADIARHHARCWEASRALFSVCGDVDPDEVRRYAARRFGKWKSGKGPGKRPWTEPTIDRRVAVFPADRQQVHVYLGHLGIRRTDPDYAALVVLDHVLGTGPGFTSRVTRILRDELGLAYSVHASISSSAGILPGTFTSYIGTSPQHVGTALSGFVSEIQRIREEPVPDDELGLAKSYLLGAFALGFERASRRAQYAVFAERNGLSDDHLDVLCRTFASVTSEDVQRVANKHLRPADLCVAAGGPVKQAELERLLRRAVGSTRRRRA